MIGVGHKNTMIPETSTAHLNFEGGIVLGTSKPNSPVIIKDMSGSFTQYDDRVG